MNKRNRKTKSRMAAFAYEKLPAISVLGGLTLLSGCERAPTFSILGSYFPAWLFCILAGILLAWGGYWLFTRMGIEKYIQPSILVYPCIAAFFSFILWLVIFS